MEEIERGSFGSRQGALVCCCEHGNGFSVSIMPDIFRFEEFLKQKPASWSYIQSCFDLNVRQHVAQNSPFVLQC
jgi:hypothetical protein